MKDSMYEVFTKAGFPLGNFHNLDSAMKMAKAYGEFVVIKGEQMEFAGKFGVGEPADDYEWSKEYSISAKKRKKTWTRDETKTDH